VSLVTWIQFGLEELEERRKLRLRCLLPLALPLSNLAAYLKLSDDTLQWHCGSCHDSVITGHPLSIPDCIRRPVHVGFVVSSVALGQVFLRVLWFNSASIMHLFPHTHSSMTLRYVTLAVDSVVQ
jgi:hypothetical protein